MKSTTTIALALLLALILSNCQASPAAEDTPIPATAASVPASPTPAETPTMTVEPTATIEPTPTGFELGDSRIRPEDGMLMVYVPLGRFTMGSTISDLDYPLELCGEHYGKVYGPCERRWWENEQPAHTVELNPYRIDSHEVSNAQYRMCAEAGACDPPGKDTYYADPSFDTHPVVFVDWHQASDYCDWANARLPTEAELEFAARGPESLRYPWGNEFDGSRVNYCDANCSYSWADETVDDGFAQTSPVGSYPEGASWTGVLDLSGNVWEWAQDWYDASYFTNSPAQNPTGPASGTERVRRGGSWHYSADGVRGTSRFGVGPTNSEAFQGFRCADSLE